MTEPSAARPSAAVGGWRSHPAVQALAIFSAAWSFLLLSAGGVVTSKEAGLAVPDWPLSYGFVVNPPFWTQMPNLFEEHLHRLIGWVLGMQIIVLAIALQRTEPRKFMRRLGWIALIAVIVQGVMGGLRVVLLMHDLAIVHGSTGQAFFCLMVAIALFTLPSWTTDEREPRAGVDALRRRAFWAMVALFLQVIVGAVIRHSRAGHEIHILLPHILWGLIAAVLAFRAAAMAWTDHGDRPWLARPATLLASGVLIQIFLGLGTYFANVHGVQEIIRPTYQWVTASAHQAVGALVLAAALTLWLRAKYFHREASPEVAVEAAPSPGAGIA